MTISRRQIETWDPSGLTDIGEGWLRLGAEVEKLFTRYAESVGKVNGLHWQGAAADAAQRRADADKKTAIEIVDALERVANRAKQGFHDVNVPLQKARTELSGAVRACFGVSDDLVVSAGANATPERVTAAAQWQHRIRTEAAAAEAADKAVAEALRTAQTELRAVFTAVGALGAEQGKQDAALLATDPSKLNPEQLRRLIEAGRLTPEQLRALQLGDPNVLATIPASQMEYLNQLARALDGKNPQEIKSIMDRLPPEARTAIANSMQIISNKRVTVSVAGDPEVPTQGGLGLLPNKIRESLTRGDLAKIETLPGTGGGGRASSPPHDQLRLNGVRDNQAIAGIVGAADSQYKAGSDLDRGLLEVGRKYLNAQVQFEQSPHRAGDAATYVDGRMSQDKNITESIFHAVGDDKIAVRDAVADPNTGQDLVKDVLVHNWTDDGKAASRMFQFAPEDATVEDRGNDLDRATAQRTGNIMQAVAQATSSDDAWNYMKNVPGTNGASVGQLNPVLLQEVARGMSPYAGDLAGIDGGEDYKPGFNNPADNTAWIKHSPDGRVNYDGAANIVALMSTDQVAGDIFAQGAIREMVANEANYAANPQRSNADQYLANASRIEGLLDRGGTMALQDQNNDNAGHAKENYERKQRAFNAVSAIGKGLISEIPGAKHLNTLLDSVSFKESYMGGAPAPAVEALPLGYNEAGRNYNALKAVEVVHGEIPPHIRNNAAYQSFFENDRLRPLSQIMSESRQSSGQLHALGRMLNEIGNFADGTDTEAAREGYRSGANQFRR
ncbi:hypothetical protein [Nocardia brasiliensis]|uniref:TPR repeat region-containing protein n=1 Tax=Nocardia brasiliensis TaxID=37326 RepID=UPI00366FF06D